MLLIVGCGKVACGTDTEIGQVICLFPDLDAGRHGTAEQSLKGRKIAVASQKSGFDLIFIFLYFLLGHGVLFIIGKHGIFSYGFRTVILINLVDCFVILSDHVLDHVIYTAGIGGSGKGYFLITRLLQCGNGKTVDLESIGVAGELLIDKK